MTISAAVAATVSAVAVVGVVGARVGASAGASASTADSTTFVAVPPCRLVDTRPSFQVGSRSKPIGTRETHRQQVTGHVGACAVPNGAAAVSLNVTTVDPTAASFLTVFPYGSAVPNSSNLNWVPGAAPTTNEVVVKLSDSGALGFYNFAGKVDLVVDVGGYYTRNGIQDAMDGLKTKADAATVYTKNQTYARGQVDTAIATLDDDLTDEIDDKADSSTVYTKDETYARSQVDTAITTLQEDLTDAIDAKADATAVYSTDQTYTRSQVDSAIATLDDDLTEDIDAKASSDNVYDRATQESLFLGRNPNLIMRQATGDLDGIPGVDLSGPGVIVSVGTSPAIELTGPAGLSDAFGGTVDYRLDLVSVCTTGAGMVAGVAALDSIKVSVRGNGGGIVPVTLPVGIAEYRDGTECYTIDTTAAIAGSTYYLQLTTVGAVGIDTLAVTGITTTWGPVLPEG